MKGGDDAVIMVAMVMVCSIEIITVAGCGRGRVGICNALVFLFSYKASIDIFSVTIQNRCTPASFAKQSQLGGIRLCDPSR